MKNRLKVGLLSGLLVLVASASAWAQTAPDPPPTTPDPQQAYPKPPQMTYHEVEEFLTSDCRNGFPDPIQYIPLGHDENYYVSIGFWIRERGEYFSNPNFSDHPSGNAYLMQRYFLHADFHLGERSAFSASSRVASSMAGMGVHGQASTRKRCTSTRASSTSVFGNPAMIASRYEWEEKRTIFGAVFLILFLLVGVPWASLPWTK
jgi:hypothetical protein